MLASSLSSYSQHLSVAKESVAHAQMPQSTAARHCDSRALFGDAQEVRIEHYGQEYRLRQTRNGKLILTK